jgi:predicted RNA-binding protein with RPS1 domain
VHISQLARDRVEAVGDVVDMHQDVFVKVIEVEPAAGGGANKISLSMRYCSQVMNVKLHVYIMYI